MSAPRFSIVIPVYNRPREIRRALRSCQAQSYREFEVLVIDDASTDGTCEAAQACSDGRISVVRHNHNRGVCAARNTGVRRAHGEWIVFLDSDDEFLPDALALMDERTRGAGESIHRLGFSYVHPDGRLSPDPVIEAVLDYPGYLRWAEKAVRSDFSNCIRRSTFDTVRLPEGRIYERLYHLDFALRFHTLLLRDAVARVHGDAPNRLTNIAFPTYLRQKKTEASDGAKGMSELLARHGEALRRYAPNTFRSLSRQHAEAHFLAGEAARGLRLGLAFLRDYPSEVSGWATLAAGVLGPVPLAALHYANARMRV